MLRSTLRFAKAGRQPNPFNSRYLASMKADGGNASYYKVNEISNKYGELPFSIRVLLESAVRNCDEFDVTSKTVEDIFNWKENCTKSIEIPFKPARVVLQDFTGVRASSTLLPCVTQPNGLAVTSKISPQIQ